MTIRFRPYALYVPLMHYVPYVPLVTSRPRAPGGRDGPHVSPLPLSRPSAKVYEMQVV
ncbi:hypothetical protein GCM10009863_46850 [Streptomyces axinellae]|uniref:Uncharacterized protein n=1 Tax=Streptomyces axinellae TaxID=552788 RepID=A0ABN3QHH9_9ACTN